MKENEGIHRHDTSGEAWERIKELLSGQENAGSGEKQPSIHQRGSVAGAHGRPVERHTARIREPEQHT